MFALKRITLHSATLALLTTPAQFPSIPRDYALASNRDSDSAVLVEEQDPLKYCNFGYHVNQNGICVPD